MASGARIVSRTYQLQFVIIKVTTNMKKTAEQ